MIKPALGAIEVADHDAHYADSAKWTDRSPPAVIHTGRTKARSRVPLADPSDEIIQHGDWCARTEVRVEI